MAGKVTQWQCDVQNEGEITVGSQFTLLCLGEENLVSRETLQLRRPKDNPYALRILKIEELQPRSLKIVATTYVAGENASQVTGYGVTDGTNTIEFEPFNLRTKSVLPPDNPQPTPYGGYLPVELSYPLWFWLVITLFVGLITAIIGRLMFLSQQRRRFLRELSERSTSLAPYHQLQKDLRQITRTLPTLDPSQWNGNKPEESVASLEQAFYWFLAREFKIPAHKWSSSLVQREIRRIDRRLFKQAEKHLQVAYRELRRAKKNPSRFSLNDFQQLLELVRKSADVIHLHRAEESRR